jgi:hypothetical protein
MNEHLRAAREQSFDPRLGGVEVAMRIAQQSYDHAVSLPQQARECNVLSADVR